MKFRLGSDRKKRVLPLGELFSDIVSHLDCHEAFIIENLKHNWKDLVGEILATHTIPDRVFKRTLFVTADHSLFANELTLHQDSILEFLESVGATSIRRIKVEVKRIQWENKQERS